MGDGKITELPTDEGGLYFEPAFEHTSTWIIDEADESLFDDFHPHVNEVFDKKYEEEVMNVDDEIDEICGADIMCRVDGKALGKEAAEDFKANPAADKPQATIRKVDLNDIAARTVNIQTEGGDIEDESLCDDEFLLADF